MEAQSGRPDPPPLRIHHFLACGAVAALLFMIWRSQLRPENWELVDTAGAATLALFVTRQIIVAAGLTLVIFSVYWHVKGYAALAQPGQWLLVAIAISMLRSVSLSLFAPFLRESPWNKNVLLWGGSEFFMATMYVVAVFLQWVLPIVFFGWLAWRIADTLPWRILFTLRALGAALVFLLALLFRYFGWSGGSAIMLLATTASVGVMACAVWAPAHDYMRGIRRTWTHWTGIGLFLALYVVGAAKFGFFYLNLS